MTIIKPPNIEQLQAISQRHGLDLAPDELARYKEHVDDVIRSYVRLDALDEPRLPLSRDIVPGQRPGPTENPLNAWYWRSDIRGAAEGILSGKRVAIKDNVCVAGLPMMNGSSVLEGYVPDFDATVVSRILEAGGQILGKAVCEHLCFSGSSFTSDTGPVLNPHNTAHSAGGSSSGSAALVAAGEVDMAIGGDQGGSIRIPSAWCGVYGLKPTHGLVPYTGAFPIEITLDHVGPIGATVHDVALLLQAIAGDDGLDPRAQPMPMPAYADELTRDIKGLNIGVLSEGFGRTAVSEAAVDATVLAGAAVFEESGARVVTVSVPMHLHGQDIWNGIATEGATMLMVQGNGMGTNWKGHYSGSLLEHYASARATKARLFSDTVKLVILAGQYMQDAYHGRLYAKAQNVARVLRESYDAALRQVDLLLMPTTPMTAPRLPGPDAAFSDRLDDALGMMHNTCAFDVTGHPAMTIPCGVSEGLPIGMMLVGRHGEEMTVLRAARAFEKAGVYQAPARARGH